jgi:signal transduction histidine kinase
MGAAPDPLSDENRRLRHSINDLVSILALPAMWTGGSPSQIVGTLIDALLEMLKLDIIYVCLANADEPPTATEIARFSEAWRPALTSRDAGVMLRGWLGENSQKWPPISRNSIGDGHISIAHFPLGLHGEIGFLAAGAKRNEFPEQIEKLVLNVAANQAAIGLHSANVLGQQKRIADELERRVAERTAELAKTNKDLAASQAALISAFDDVANSEAKLRNTQAELARVTRAMTMGQLTASIAHEVNQPLSGIVTNASTCLRMLDAHPPNLEGARETARRAIRDGNRASDVITRLRTLYSKNEPTLESMDLNEATREVIALSLSEIQRSGVILRQELASELPPVVGDRVQLQQVILNLLRNAADAMGTIDDRPKDLLIRTESDDKNQIRLSVKDSGVGFTAQTADKIFEAFYTTKTDGMGIGLSISRSIIEAHQGRIWATPNDGPGCTFSFAVPRALQMSADA